ncbi:MAG: type II secretion system protein GspM [Burkholderiales bacterium]
MRETSLTWWRERSARERWMIGGTAALVLALIVFFFLWQPLNAERLRLAKRVPELKNTLARMQTQAQEVKGVQSRSKPRSLEVALEETSREIALPKGAIRSDGLERARINLAAIEFNKWIAWTAKLQQERAIRLEAAQIEALAEPGMVKVNALLTTATGK